MIWTLEVGGSVEFGYPLPMSVVAYFRPKAERQELARLSLLLAIAQLAPLMDIEREQLLPPEKNV
jgi:hypothetical protein